MLTSHEFEEKVHSDLKEKRRSTAAAYVTIATSGLSLSCYRQDK